MLDLFKEKIMLAEFFSYKGQACLLNKQGRSLFYPAFEHQMKTWQKGINRMARLMVNELDHQINELDRSTYTGGSKENYSLF